MRALGCSWRDGAATGRQKACVAPRRSPSSSRQQLQVATLPPQRAPRLVLLLFAVLAADATLLQRPGSRATEDLDAWTRATSPAAKPGTAANFPFFTKAGSLEALKLARRVPSRRVATPDPDVHSTFTLGVLATMEEAWHTTAELASKLHNKPRLKWASTWLPDEDQPVGAVNFAQAESMLAWLEEELSLTLAEVPAVGAEALGWAAALEQEALADEVAPSPSAVSDAPVGVAPAVDAATLPSPGPGEPPSSATASATPSAPATPRGLHKVQRWKGPSPAGPEVSVNASGTNASAPSPTDAMAMSLRQLADALAALVLEVQGVEDEDEQNGDDEDEGKEGGVKKVRRRRRRRATVVRDTCRTCDYPEYMTTLSYCRMQEDCMARGSECVDPDAERSSAIVSVPVFACSEEDALLQAITDFNATMQAVSARRGATQETLDNGTAEGGRVAEGVPVTVEQLMWPPGSAQSPFLMPLPTDGRAPKPTAAPRARPGEPGFVPGADPHAVPPRHRLEARFKKHLPNAFLDDIVNVTCGKRRAPDEDAEVVVVVDEDGVAYEEVVEDDDDSCYVNDDGGGSDAPYDDFDDSAAEPHAFRSLSAALFADAPVMMAAPPGSKNAITFGRKVQPQPGEADEAEASSGGFWWWPWSSSRKEASPTAAPAAPHGDAQAAGAAAGQEEAHGAGGGSAAGAAESSAGAGAAAATSPLPQQPLLARAFSQITAAVSSTSNVLLGGALLCFAVAVMLRLYGKGSWMKHAKHAPVAALLTTVAGAAGSASPAASAAAVTDVAAPAGKGKKGAKAGEGKARKGPPAAAPVLPQAAAPSKAASRHIDVPAVPAAAAATDAAAVSQASVEAVALDESKAPAPAPAAAVAVLPLPGAGAAAPSKGHAAAAQTAAAVRDNDAGMPPQATSAPTPQEAVAATESAASALAPAVPSAPRSRGVSSIGSIGSGTNSPPAETEGNASAAAPKPAGACPSSTATVKAALVAAAAVASGTVSAKKSAVAAAAAAVNGGASKAAAPAVGPVPAPAPPSTAPGAKKQWPASSAGSSSSGGGAAGTANGAKKSAPAAKAPVPAAPVAAPEAAAKTSAAAPAPVTAPAAAAPAAASTTRVEQLTLPVASSPQESPDTAPALDGDVTVGASAAPAPGAAAVVTSVSQASAAAPRKTVQPTGEGGARAAPAPAPASAAPSPAQPPLAATATQPQGSSAAAVALDVNTMVAALRFASAVMETTDAAALARRAELCPLFFNLATGVEYYRVAELLHAVSREGDGAAVGALRLIASGIAVRVSLVLCGFLPAAPLRLPPITPRNVADALVGPTANSTSALAAIQLLAGKFTGEARSSAPTSPVAATEGMPLHFASPPPISGASGGLFGAANLSSLLAAAGSLNSPLPSPSGLPFDPPTPPAAPVGVAPAGRIAFNPNAAVFSPPAQLARDVAAAAAVAADIQAAQALLASLGEVHLGSGGSFGPSSGQPAFVVHAPIGAGGSSSGGVTPSAPGADGPSAAPFTALPGGRAGGGVPASSPTAAAAGFPLFPSSSAVPDAAGMLALLGAGIANGMMGGSGAGGVSTPSALGLGWGAEAAALAAASGSAAATASMVSPPRLSQSADASHALNARLLSQQAAGLGRPSLVPGSASMASPSGDDSLRLPLLWTGASHQPDAPLPVGSPAGTPFGLLGGGGLPGGDSLFSGLGGLGSLATPVHGHHRHSLSGGSADDSFDSSGHAAVLASLHMDDDPALTPSDADAASVGLGLGLSGGASGGNVSASSITGLASLVASAGTGGLADADDDGGASDGGDGAAAAAAAAAAAPADFSGLGLTLGSLDALLS